MSKEPSSQRDTARTGFRIFVAFAILVPFVWSIGFVRYVASIPREVSLSQATTDAIVVLTGGTKRVAVGFQLLIDG